MSLLNHAIKFDNNINFKHIFSLGLILRIIIFLYLILFPITHNLYGEISPFTYQTFSDLGFYITFGEKKFSLVDFFDIYKKVFTINFDQINNRYPGPLFSILIFVTNYSPSFPYILGLLIFISEIAAFYFWSKFLYEKIDKLSSLIFCFIPIPLFFGFLHSTDMLMYLFSTIIYFYAIDYFKPNKLILCFFVFLLAITKPTCLFILFPFFIYYCMKKNNKFEKIIILLIFLFSIFYYIPYFFYEMNFSNKILYYSYVDLNLNNIFYIILNFLHKIFLLLGFISSDSGNNYIYLVRFVCATVFLLGYLYSFFYFRNYFDLFLINFLIVNIALFFFPAYRYSLQITPLLYMYFYLFLKHMTSNLHSSSK